MPKSPWARFAGGLRLRAAIAAYVVRRVAPPLLLAAAYTLAVAALVRWDQARAGAALPDFGSTAYGLYTQLFFEPFDPLPASALSRIVYWVTPLAGVFLVAEGLVKVGAPLFDGTSRREIMVNIMSRQMNKHVVVCGLGHVGYRIVEELHRLGEDVVAIEQEETGGFVDLVRAMGVPVHVGDARRDDLLTGTNIAHARAVVCTTGDDLANIEVAVDSKRMNPGIRVVLRMFDQRLAEKIGAAIEVDQSFSSSALSAPLVAVQATHVGVRSAYRLDDVVRVTAEVVVSSKASLRTVAEVEEQGSCRVVGRRAEGAPTFAPARASDSVAPGDTLVVDTAAVDLPSVRYQLGG